VKANRGLAHVSSLFVTLGAELPLSWHSIHLLAVILAYRLPAKPDTAFNLKRANGPPIASLLSAYSLLLTARVERGNGCGDLYLTE
jgi:hypothetical protein